MHNNETFRVDFRPNFSQEHLKNVLETALIYCGYWGRWQDGRWEEVFEAPSNCSTKGIVLYVEDQGEEFVLSPRNLQRGLQLIMMEEYAHLFPLILKGEADAGQADCFSQLCLFGQILYG